METGKMRIVIVEDNTQLRESLGLLLGGEHNREVVGSFGMAEEALPVICAERPDALLVDLGLPGMSGIELIRQVKAAAPEVEALVHTISDDRDSVFAALKAGAAGYILKGVTPRELIEALNDLGTGGAPYPEYQRQRRELYDQGRYQEAAVHWTPADRNELVAIKALLAGRKPRLACRAVGKGTVSFWIRHAVEQRKSCRA